MNEDNPVRQSYGAKIRAVDGFLAALRQADPDGKVTAFKEDFESLDALEDADTSVMYVLTVLKQDLHLIMDRSTGGTYAPDLLQWLWTIKNALRTAGHLTDTLMEVFPEEFEDFMYTMPPKTLRQLIWSVMTFATLELGKTLYAIEECYPEMQEEFAHQRKEYSQLWAEEWADFQEHQRIEAALAAHNHTIQ